MKSAIQSMSLAGLFAAFVIGGDSAAWAQSGTRQPGPVRSRAAATHSLALRGYCPVCVIGSGSWVPGRPEITSVYDGLLYRFPGDEQKQMFDAEPGKYAPVLNGDSVVALVKTAKRVPGKLDYAQIYGGRLYLFASENERRAFQQAPRSFVDGDLAFGGDCAVCRVARQASMPGKPEFSARYRGLRYYFVDAMTRDMFLASPGKFAVPATGGSGAKSSDGGSGSR
ncbi:MAG: hypothetical protein ACYC61_05915 [Isosphaeraceae bacterium]